MKKNELIHLHSLLVEIGGDFVERGVATRDDFRTYDRLGIGPMALRERRADHETAVRTLTATLAVCAAHDLGRDRASVPGRELRRPPDRVDASAD